MTITNDIITVTAGDLAPLSQFVQDGLLNQSGGIPIEQYVSSLLNQVIAAVLASHYKQAAGALNVSALDDQIAASTPAKQALILPLVGDIRDILES